MDKTDKIYELLTLMHAENLKRFDGLDQRMDNMDQRMDMMDLKMDNMGRQMVRMEYEFKDQIAILHDGVQGNTEAIKGLSVRMEAVEKQLERHEIKLIIVK